MRKLITLLTLTVSFLGAAPVANRVNPPACGDNCPWVRVNPPACGDNCPWVRVNPPACGDNCPWVR
jgi:hypothetical protein